MDGSGGWGGDGAYIAFRLPFIYQWQKISKYIKQTLIIMFAHFLLINYILYYYIILIY